ncbi:pseudouridine synthase [Diplocarpon rosae]|nr:pseudouridine synthase [Diplocarpon rosae]
MTPKKIMEGVFGKSAAVHKPSGISSAQALRDLQRHFNPSELFAPWMDGETEKRQREAPNQRKRRRNKNIQVKIGHGGTLDPLATGVLITGVGSGTKALQDFLSCTKVYETVVLFGTSTDSYDRVGKVLKRAPYAHITREMVEEALEQFRGKFMQLPPLFSALKMNGKPLYEYAREGKQIPRQIERRPVEVLNLELVEWMEGGTHGHVAPTDEAGHAEINVANKLWKQESAVPGASKRRDDGAESGPPSPRIKVDQVESGSIAEGQDVGGGKGAAGGGERVAAGGLLSEGTGDHIDSKISTGVAGEGGAGTSQPDSIVGNTEAIVAEERSGSDTPLAETTEAVTEAGIKASHDVNKLHSSPRAETGIGSAQTMNGEDGESEIPEAEATALSDFESQKRKLSDNQDDLVHERPASKHQRKAAPPTTADTAIMSGGLASPSVDPASDPLAKGPPAVRLRMTVTSGFYVRSLCHDLGTAVGSAALMAELERTRQGDFAVGQNVLAWEDLGKGEKVWGPKVEAWLDDWHHKHS